MSERMTQVLGNLRRAVGPDKWDAFFEAMYDAFGKYDQLDGENAVLFEQVQVLKRENNELRMKFIAANRKSIDLEHEVADLKAEYEGRIEPPHHPDTWERIIEDAFNAAIQGADERWDSGVDRDILVARCKELCERTMSGDAE